MYRRQMLRDKYIKENKNAVSFPNLKSNHQKKFTHNIKGLCLLKIFYQQAYLLEL